MLRGAAVIFLVAVLPSHGLREPAIQSYFAHVDLLKGFIAVAEVGSPPEEVGATLWAWDRIKTSNDVPELEGFVSRYEGSFLAELAKRRIQALETQRLIRPPAPLPMAK